MLILNATTKVKSLMTDKGDLITITPGEVSTLMIATRNMIISAINLGTPKEIGIVLSGSYELEIAKSITGAVPYLYTDEMEAKAKLLDASIDYKGILNASKINLGNEQLIKEKDEVIKNLNIKLLQVENELNTYKSGADDLLKNNEKKYAKLEMDFQSMQVEKDRYKNQLAESQDQIKEYTDKVNLLQSQLGSKTQELIGCQNKITELSEQLSNNDNESLIDELAKAKKELNAQSEITNSLNETINSLKDEVKGWKKGCTERDTQVKELTASLKEASETIDNMKSEFNKACELFKITKDDQGNWIQLP